MTKTLKIAFLVGLLMLFSLPVYAATDAEIVSSFQQYVNDNMTQVFQTYDGHPYRILFSEHSKTYFKSTHTVDTNYKIDLQKTNSLISPYVGTLEVTNNVAIYVSNKDKAIAEGETKVDIRDKETYKFSIAYQNEQWVVTAIRQYSEAFGKWYDYPVTDIVKTLGFKDK